jgi:hypothetical protein
MKRLVVIALITIILLSMMTMPVYADKPTEFDNKGNVQAVSDDKGFDKWGYNIAANMFSGLYGNWALQKFLSINHDGDEANDVGPAGSAAEAQNLLDAALAAGDITPGEYNTASYYNQWGDTYLIMKWNDAWSTEEGAWITNHMRTKYLETDGKEHQEVYFTKIVKAPADAYKSGGVWYTADGVEIGHEIWGSYATILSVYNYPYYDYHGAEYVSPAAAGFGYYGP